jgi:hypothetical protein
MESEKTEVCDQCKKEFTGGDAKAQLFNHMKSHNVRERVSPKENRKERIPFGMPQRKFNCPENDGFHYRIFNDNWAADPGRIQRAKLAGYEIVEGSEQIPVGTNENGTAIKGILMRIPQTLFDEDQKLKQKEVDRVDEAIKGGTLEQGQNDKRYSRDGIRMWGSHSENA